MIEYLIGWANIVWGVTLAAALFGANKYIRMTESQQEELTKTVKGLCGAASLTYIIVGMWLVLRCLYALGLLLQVELLLVVGSVCFLTRAKARGDAIKVYQGNWLLQNTENIKTVLGNDLPQWLRYPTVSRAQWLNTMVSNMWESIAAATEASLRQVIEPLLESSKPSFIYSLVLKECSLGKNPIVINGVQHHPSNDNSSIIDLTLSWDSDTNIHLHIKMPGPDMHVYMRRFELNMQVRFILSPHIPQWPCFASISVSIMKIWLLNFDISAAGVPLDAVPAVGTFLDNFVRDTLVGMLQYPKSITIPMVKDYMVLSTRADAAVGTLRISLLRVEDWNYRYVSEWKSTPFYVKLLMSGNEEKKRLKSKIYKGLDTKLQDTFSFVLYDKTKTLHFWLYFDVIGNDYCVGECDVPVEVLLTNKQAEYTCYIYKSTESQEKSRAKLIILSEFLQYSGKCKGDSIAAPNRTPTRSVSSDFLKRAAAGECSLGPPSTRSTNNGSVNLEELGSGTLFITVKGCSGLKNKEHIGVSDPYVVLRLGKQRRQSQYQSSTLDPVFNFEAELDVCNIATDVLQLTIMDKNDMRKDAVMGTLSIRISQVALTVRDQLTGQFNLDPQGKVELQLRLLYH